MDELENSGPLIEELEGFIQQGLQEQHSAARRLKLIHRILHILHLLRTIRGLEDLWKALSAFFVQCQIHDAVNEESALLEASRFEQQVVN